MGSRPGCGIPAAPCAGSCHSRRVHRTTSSQGSSGNGSSLHIGLALFQAATGVEVVHVPYKGSGPALVDAVSGQIQTMHTTTVSAEGQIKSGRVKVIGVAS